MNTQQIKAGAAAVDITPREPAFLHGYPHAERISTGTHDPLLAASLCIESGPSACLTISADVLFVDKAIVAAARKRITEATGIASNAVLISATHTHSGPVTVDCLCTEADPVVPPVDPAYLRELEDGLVAAATLAWQTRRPAELAFAIADATGIGTARHDPRGLSDLKTPVVIVREKASHAYIGLLVVCAMHPTILHEDSTLFSGDFPAAARAYLQRRVVGDSCPVVYHTGVSGDQSPRHVTRGNTFDEADRIGGILGAAVERAIAATPTSAYRDDAKIAAAQQFVDLPVRQAPPVELAEQRLQAAKAKLNALRGSASRADVRTAECDWFGAEESLAIAHAAEDGRLGAKLATILPAEIQSIAIGDRTIVGWPGELFVAFAMRLKQRHPNTIIVTLANGELQGYVVTQEAADRQWYEAGNALLRSPAAGDRIVDATDALLRQLRETATHA